MSDKITHDGTVKTNELTQPGYVSFRCDAWGLDDNTMGKIGWHVEYRPLCGDYQHDCEITEAMATAVREHYAAQQATEDATQATVEAEASEWRSHRGLTLAEEMEREDTIY